MTEKLVLKTLKGIKKEPKKYLQIFLLNLFFWIVFIFLSKVIGFLIEQSMDYLMSLSFTLKILIGLSSFATSLLLPTLIYSFFKMLILSKIGKKEKLFGLFWRFYVNNLVIFVFLNIVVLVWLFVSSAVKTSWMIPYMILTLGPIVFFAYSFINIYHSLVVKEKNTKMIREALIFTFGNISKYAGFIVPNMILILVYLACLWIVGTSLMSIMAQSTYMIIISADLYILFLLLITFNQSFFYRITLGNSPD